MLSVINQTEVWFLLSISVCVYLLFMCVHDVPVGTLATKTQDTRLSLYAVTSPDRISRSHKYGHFGANIHIFDPLGREHEKEKTGVEYPTEKVVGKGEYHLILKDK